MVFRLFRRKDKTPPADEPLAPVPPSDAPSEVGEEAGAVPAATGAGTPTPETAQPKALKARRASEARKGRRPAPKPARKTGQPAKAARKAGAGGKAAKPKKGKGKR